MFLRFMFTQPDAVDVFVSHLEMSTMGSHAEVNKQPERRFVGRAHPVCVDASPPVVTEDKLDEARERRVFIGR